MNERTAYICAFSIIVGLLPLLSGPVTGGDTRDKVTGPGAWGGPEGLKTRENAKNCANRRVEIGPPGGPYEIPKGHWGPHGPLTDPPEPTWAPQRLL